MKVGEWYSQVWPQPILGER